MTANSAPDAPAGPDLAAEYRLTMRVLAIVAERLLTLTKGERVLIDESALRDSPDIVSWVDRAEGQIVIKVSR